MQNACQLIVDNKEYLRAAGLLAILAFETWIGKTDKVNAGSTLELVYHILSGQPVMNQQTQQEKTDATK